MGGSEPLGTLIVSSGQLSHKGWLNLCMNKDGLFRRLTPQDSVQGWANLVLTFPRLCKRETCSGPSQLRAQAILPLPKLCLCGQYGGWRVEGKGLLGQVGSRLLLGSCELPVLSRLAGLTGAHLCFYGSSEDVIAA